MRDEDWHTYNQGVDKFTAKMAFEREREREKEDDRWKSYGYIH